MKKILVVDDEPGVRSALDGILRDEGYEVSTVESGEACLELLESQSVDAILLDVWLPGIDGLETLKRLRERTHDPQVVMISGHGTIETAVRATKLGAFDFVEKPLSLEKTLVVLGNALRQQHLETANRELLAQLVRDTEILGRSRAATQLRQAVEVAAATDAPVLIRGNLGSGRENVARRVHASGERAERPFVGVPGGALDASAAEAAIFGSEGNPGRLSLADGGTLFLEDADRLAPALQRRLAATLSVLIREARAPRLLSSTGPRADDLHAELRSCLDVVRIDVPSLTERREDIPFLAERFMRDFSREYGREPRRLAPDCLNALQSHDWPGELRELRNVVERLLVFSEGAVVATKDLPIEIGGSRASGEDLYRDFESLDAGIRAFRRYYVGRVMTDSGGDKAATATRLGLDPGELERLLKAN